VVLVEGERVDVPEHTPVGQVADLTNQLRCLLVCYCIFRHRDLRLCQGRCCLDQSQHKLFSLGQNIFVFRIFLIVELFLTPFCLFGFNGACALLIIVIGSVAGKGGGIFIGCLINCVNLRSLVVMDDVVNLSLLSNVRYDLDGKLARVLEHVLDYVVLQDRDGPDDIFVVFFLLVEMAQWIVEFFGLQDVVDFVLVLFFGSANLRLHL